MTHVRLRCRLPHESQYGNVERNFPHHNDVRSILSGGDDAAGECGPQYFVLCEFTPNSPLFWG